MTYKIGWIFLTLLVGSIAFPVSEEDDLAFFFDYPVADPFIVGGSPASDSVPHMVGLTTGFLIKSLLCGGSIINERFILTAAHCIREVSTGSSVISSLRALLGSNRWSSSRIEHRLSRAINHPDYNHNTIKNDIGFLVTSTSIVFNDNVKPIVINFDFVGDNVSTIANGWGRLSTGGRISQILMELRPVSVDGEKCVTEVARVAALMNLRPPPVHPELEICTFLRSNSGMCHGDSGSALILEENNQQVGVVSWGIPCAKGAPDMYARLSAYRSWIEQQISIENIM